MSRLRIAATAWIEAGRCLGYAEAYRQVRARIDRCPPDFPASGLWGQGMDLEAAAADASAATAQRTAELVMAEIEHPGARLARRLVAAVRGARAAWRAAR